MVENRTSPDFAGGVRFFVIIDFPGRLFPPPQVVSPFFISTKKELRRGY